MPWCDDCSKFWNPNTLPPDGRCPNCGTEVGEPAEIDDYRAPWHFKVMVVATVVYLGWRAVQLIQVLV